MALVARVTVVLILLFSTNINSSMRRVIRTEGGGSARTRTMAGARTRTGARTRPGPGLCSPTLNQDLDPERGLQDRCLLIVHVCPSHTPNLFSIFRTEPGPDAGPGRLDCWCCFGSSGSDGRIPNVDHRDLLGVSKAGCTGLHP